MLKVLLADSDPVAVQVQAARLSNAKFQVTTTDTSEDVLSLLRHYVFDVLLLHQNLRDERHDFETLRRLRQRLHDLPVIILAANVHPRVTVLALNSGADDCVAMPFDVEEMAARIHAIVRRMRGYASSHLVVGELSVNLASRLVLVREEEVQITPTEFDLLSLLMLRKGRVVPRELILDYLYSKPSDEPDIKIIDVLICKLRKKLQARLGTNYIDTIWGRGYMFKNQPQDSIAA